MAMHATCRTIAMPASAATKAVNREDVNNTMFLSAAAADGDVFRSVLALNHLPPYWLMFVSGCTKICIMTVVFGIPKTYGQGAGIVKVSTACFFAVVSACGVLTDFHHVVTVLAAAQLTWWEKINGCAIAISISGNLQTWAAMHAMYVMYIGSWKWRNLHNVAESTSPQEYARNYQSRVWWWWFRAMSRIYAPMYVLMWSLYGIVLWTLYVWLTVGLALIGAGGGTICYRCLQKVVVAQRKNHEDNTMQAYTDDASKKAVCTAYIKNQIRESSEPSMGIMTTCVPSIQSSSLAVMDKMAEASAEMMQYDEEFDWCKRIGVTYDVFKSSFTMPMFNVMINCSIPVVARFYIGEGYWESLHATWNDRHAAEYIQYMITAAATERYTYAAWLSEANRWVQSFTFWI